jgi:hypothetical protein
MAKLGYTWYPKDWGNSESVFELNLEERGLYREFIDLAMLNDNTTEIKLDVWCRKFAIQKDDLLDIIRKLSLLNLIEMEGEKLFIPSCESRLKLVRGGSNGGKKSKPTSKPNSKPTSKPFESLDGNNEKPTTKQREKKDKIKETKLNIDFDFFWNLYDKKVGSKTKCVKKWKLLKDEDRQKIIDTLPDFLNGIKDKKFQPHPETYLNNNRWEDEIHKNSNKNKYTLYSPLGKHEFELTEPELNEKLKGGNFKLEP